MIRIFWAWLSNLLYFRNFNIWVLFHYFFLVILHGFVLTWYFWLQKAVIIFKKFLILLFLICFIFVDFRRNLNFNHSKWFDIFLIQSLQNFTAEYFISRFIKIYSNQSLSVWICVNQARIILFNCKFFPLVHRHGVFLLLVFY